MAIWKLHTTQLNDGSYLNDDVVSSGLAPTIVNDPDSSYSGRKALRCFIDFNQPQGNAHQFRCEITPSGSHTFRIFSFGQRYWLAQRIYLDAGYTRRDGEEEVIMQWHAGQAHTIGWGDRGGPPVAIVVAGDIGAAGGGDIRLRVQGDPAQDSTKASPTRVINSPLRLKKPNGANYTVADWVGKWMSVVTDIKWDYSGTNNTGHVIVYVNGFEAGKIVGKPNCYNDPEGPFYKTGIYKPVWNFSYSQTSSGWKGSFNGVTTRLHYFADLAIADASSHGFDDVAPPPAEAPPPPPPAGDDPGADPGTLLLESGFTAADSTAITSITPSTDVMGGGFSGDAEIQGNALAFGANGEYAAIGVGTPNHRVRVTWTANSAANRGQIILRASQGNASLPASGYAITIRTDVSNIQLGVITGGVNTLLVSSNYTLTTSATYTIIAEIWNNLIRVWIDDGQVIRQVIGHEDTTHPTGDYIQLRHVTYASTGGRFDNLKVYGINTSLQPLIRVQRLPGTIPANALTQAVTAGFIAPATTSKTLLRVCGAHGLAMGHAAGLTSGQAFQETLFRAEWAGATQINLTRHSVGTNNRDSQGELEIIESLASGANGFTVLARGTANLSGLSFQSSALSGVTDPGRVWVRITGMSYNGSGNTVQNVGCTAQLVSDGADLDVLLTRGFNAGTVSISWEAIQMGSNWTVQTVAATISTAGSVQTATVFPTVDWTKTLPFLTARTAGSNDQDAEIHVWPGANGGSLKLFAPTGAATPIPVVVWLLSHPNLAAQHANSIDGAWANLPTGSGLQTETRTLASAVIPEKTLLAATAGNRQAAVNNTSANWNFRVTSTGATIQAKRSRGGQVSGIAVSVGVLNDAVATPPPPPPPLPPPNLRVTTLGGVVTILEWDESFSQVGIAEYGYRLDSAAIVWTGSTTRSLSLHNLGEYVEYTVSVYPKDTNGQLSNLPSQVIFRTHDVTAPTIPASPSAVAVSAKQVRITSAGSTDLHSGIGYYLLKIDGDYFLDEQDDLVEIGASELPMGWLLTGQTPGATLTFELEAVDRYSNVSASSDTFQATLYAVPGVPVITAEALDENTIQISRTTPSGLIHDYQLYLDDVLEVTFTSAQISVALFNPGQTVKVQVRSRNTIDNLQSELSDAVLVTTLDLTPPTVPGKPVAGAVTAFGVPLTATGSTDATSGVAGYRWYRNGVFQAQTVDPTWTDPNPGEFVTNSYRVSAIDNDGNESAQSLATAVTTADVSGPSTPTGSIQTAGATWLKITSPGSTDTGSGVDYYLLSVNGVLRDQPHQRITQFPYALTGLLPGSTYQLRLFAYDRVGNVSSQSAIFEGRTSVRPPANTIVATANALVTSPFSAIHTRPGSRGGRTSRLKLALLTAHADGTMDVLPAVGTGTPTYSRASAALVRDYANVYRTIAVDMPRIQGARYDGSVAYWRLEDNTPLHPTSLVDGVRLFEHYRRRANSTAYTVGSRVIPASGSGTAGGNGYWYECTVAGTSHTAAPTWPTTVDQTVTDGGVTWRCGGYYRIGGLLLERSGTNQLLNSNNFVSGASGWNTWLGNAVTTSASVLFPGQNRYLHTSTAGHDRTQNITVSAGTTVVGTWMVERYSGSVLTRCALVDADISAGTFVTRVRIDWATNTVTQDNGTAANVLRAEIWGDYALIVLRGVITGTTARHYIQPRSGATGDGCYVHFAQLEVASAGSSPIPTTTAAVSRAADAAITLPKASNFSDTSGILIADYQPANWASPAGYILGDADGYVLKPLATNTGAQAYDGTNTANGPTGTPTGMVRAAVQWGNGLMSVAVHGSAGAESDYDGSFNLGETLEIGEDFAGLIRNVRVLE